MNRSTVQKRVYDLASEANVLAEKWRALLSEMQEHFDVHSEKWQESQSGEMWQSLMDDIESETDKLEEVGAFDIG